MSVHSPEQWSQLRFRPSVDVQLLFRDQLSTSDLTVVGTVHGSLVQYVKEKKKKT